MKLKIFSEYDCSPGDTAYEPILYPFWGMASGDSKVFRDGYYPWQECFADYIQVGKSVFQMSALEEADVAIVPLNWVEAQTPVVELQLTKFVAKTRQAGKPSISFFGGDHSHAKLPTDCDLVFRHSMYASTRKQHDFAMPAWSEDFISSNFNNQIIPRQKQFKPKVGFCGFSAKTNFKTYGKSILYATRKLWHKKPTPIENIGHVLRLKALGALTQSSVVQTNFVLREKPFFNEQNPNLQKMVREQYIQNMLESDYILCCRGYGNFSFRFYEALSCGRIPVFINSDCVLPYDFEIDWKKYCVWVEEPEIHLIGEKIAQFHEQLQPQEFLDLQYKCRRMWQKWLSPEGFYTSLYRHLPLVS